jgi:hypothetical protein
MRLGSTFSDAPATSLKTTEHALQPLMMSSHVFDDDGEVSLSRREEDRDELDFLGGEDQNERFVSSDSNIRRQAKNGLDFWGDSSSSSIAEQKSGAAVPAKSVALEDDLDFVGGVVIAEQKSEATVPAKSVGDRHSGGAESTVDLKPASKMELYLHVLNATCQVCFFCAIFEFRTCICFAFVNTRLSQLRLCMLLRNGLG